MLTRLANTLRRIPRGWYTALLIAYWLGMTGWLVFREAYPGLFEQATTGYRAMFSGGLLVMDRWMKITFQGAPIGYSHTSVDVNDKDPLAQITFGNRTLLNLNLMGQTQHVSVTVRADLDAFYALHRFLFILSTQGYSVSISGRRVKDNLFAVTTHTAGRSDTVTIEIPEDAVIYSPMTETALKALRPGRQMRLRVFNPVSMSTETIVVRSLREEPLQQNGHSIPTTVVSMNYLGAEVLSWVNAEGEIVRQETPYGWTMEASSANEALALSGQAGADLLTATAVPVDGILNPAARATQVRYRLRGAPVDAAALQTHRQHVDAATGSVVELTVRADALPAQSPPLNALAAGHADALAATPALQATDPRLIRQAQKIIGAHTNSLEAALALYDWVYRNVVKKPTASLPSALDVLARMEGDCNEHTYLFVGLARAAGIPALIRVGITYSEGFFYYHAWPSVYVGQWLDMDPTLGQPAVDAGHIALLEGEIRSQMNLLPLLGRLRVEIVAPRPGAVHKEP